MAHSLHTSPQRDNLTSESQNKNPSIISYKPLLIPSEKDIEAKQFVKSLKLEQQQRLERQKQLNKSVIEKRRQEFEESMNRDLERLQQTKLTREQQIEEAMNKIKQRKLERERQFNEWISQQKLNKGQEPLYVKYQREYEEKVLLPKIQNDKLLLNHIKDTMSKPLTKEEFQEHELKYKEKQKMMELEIQKKRQSMQSPQLYSQDGKLYKSHRYHLLKELETQGKHELVDKLDKLKKQKQKQETYDKFVKECHPAKPSPSKQVELISKINNLKHPVRAKKSSYDNYLIEFQKIQVDTHPDSLPEKRNKNSILKLPNSQLNSPINNKPKQIDYLKEFQSQRQAQSVLNSPTSCSLQNMKLNNQKNIINQLKKKNLTKEQKFEIVKLKSQAIEEKAKYYEHGFSHQALEVQSEVNQLYLDSIKTKMALLDQL